MGSLFDNEIQLRWLERADTYSDGIGYTTAPSDPYERNRALECWWREARTGVPFAVYRDSTIDTTKAEEPGTFTIATGTTTGIPVVGKAFVIDPQEHKDKLIYVATWATGYPQRFFVTSHTAGTITIPNSLHNEKAGGTDGSSVYVFNQRYQTYVLNTESMATFAPTEMPEIDKYELTVPLFRYVA
ncbi:MAG TPA: hypothetical protein ENH33_00555 [Actinobacteria bacterium]|nr:hypothetical protein [Actinomycetota bacterium]